RRRTLSRAPPTEERKANYWQWLWLGTFALSLRFLARDTHGGGGNVVNLALCLLAFDAAERDRPRAAGLWLGLSLATKPTQLWLLPVFLLFGKTRAVGWTVVTGLVAALLTLALQRFDITPWQRWIEGSWRLATQGDAFAVPTLDFPPFIWMNQSLRCAIARWGGDVPPDLAARVIMGVPPGLGLSPMVLGWLTRVVSLGLLGWLLTTAWRTRSTPTSRLWVFAGALVVSVLLSPLSWKAHHMALVPMLFLLLQRAVRERRRGHWCVLAAWAVCCLPGKELIGNAADEWGNSVYVVTVWDVVLFAIAMRAARVRGSTDAAPANTPTRA
ncbi:MAG: glycosyltransferase 87 family protein, partial [Planctomycetota bacterium]